MTAFRRMKFGTFGGFAALAALCLASPAFSQNSDAPVDVTAAPPPSAATVGPSTLRDFTLQGTVTRPSDGPAAAPGKPATTAPAAPRPDEAVPGEAAARPARPRTEVPVARPQLTPANPSRAAAGSQEADRAGPVTPSQPLEVRTGPAPQPGFASTDTDSDPGVAPRLDTGDGSLPWPWLVALAALIAGGAYIAWSRNGRRSTGGDPGRMAFVGLGAEPVPEPGPRAPAGPRPDPVPPRAQPGPTPRGALVPGVAARPVPKPAPADDGLVISTRFKPELGLEFIPERVVVTPTEAALQFEVIVANAGSAPARDVLIEAKMFTAHPGQDQEIAGFFHQPIGNGDRIPAISPLGKLSLKSAVRIPLDQLRSFEAGGRTLFVPLVGFNILFRSGSGEEQVSASFLVGRGSEEDEKLAPFRLDLGSRIFRGLSARRHSLGLQPA